MITLDTSVLFAHLNQRDANHNRILSPMDAEPGPWIVPVAVLGELGYFLNIRGTTAALDVFLLDIEEGTYVLDAGADDISRVRSLVQRYADFPLGLVDAIVIACAERNGGRVATLVQRHFGVVASGRAIAVVPSPKWYSRPDYFRPESLRSSTRKP